MKRTMYRAALALLALVVLIAASVPALAAGEKYAVTVSDGTEGTAQVSVGDTVTLRVTVSGAAFNGMQAGLAYDSALFELTGFTGPAAADDPATAALELYLLSDAALADGTEVAVAEFRAKSAGTGTFAPTAATVGNYADFRSGDAAPAATADDTVTVKKSGSSGGGTASGGTSGGEVKASGITVKPLSAAFRGSAEGKALPDGTVEVTVRDENGNTLAAVPGGVLVTVPDVQAGQVVAIVDENGAIRDIVEKSLVENGRAYVLLSGSARIRIIDNAKAFSDVKEGDWFRSAVDFVSSHELLVGVGEGQFAPQMPFTRAMMATVLWRLEDCPAANAAAPFRDVERGSWYAAAVDWASEKGIALGYSETVFAPGDAVTREQMAALLYRYWKALGYAADTSAELTPYTDAGQVSAWAAEAMRWAVGCGLLVGRSNTELAPQATATRAEVATMFQRLVTLMVKPQAV